MWQISLHLKLILWQQTQDQLAVKKLEGRGKEYRLRSGDYRIVYRIEGTRLVVEVIRIGHRREVYKKK